MNTSVQAVPRRLRLNLVAAVTLISCVGLTAAPVANAGPIEDLRGAVDASRNDSLCFPMTYSGELEGYAMKWVNTARALGTLNTPTFPADAYPGEDAIGTIASGDPTATARGQLMRDADVDIKQCSWTEYGVGMSRDDVTELSYVAVVLGKPKTAPPTPAPPKNGLPPAPAEPAAPAEPKEFVPPPQPKATVLSDVDVYSAPGGEGSPTGILRGAEVVDFWGCIEEQWCHVTGAAVPNGDGWVWGEFLQR
jgi:hypothetical protein